MVRAGLSALVSSRWPDATILVAPDFTTAWALASAEIDLCLVDLDMPGASPRAGVKGLMQAAPKLALLVVTGSHDDALLLDLLAMGVAGFASKQLAPPVLEAAIALVLAGGRYVPDRLVELQAIRSTTNAVAGEIRLLSARQREVVRLLVRGLTNKDIARVLDVSPATVKTHVAQIIALTGAVNRTDASVRAQGLGLL